MNIRTKASVWMILLTVLAFILGGIVTYYFVPSGFSSYRPPPWSPRVETRQSGEGERIQRKESGKDPAEIERRTRFVQRWKDKLDLSDEQAEQFQMIFTAGHEKFVAAAEDSSKRHAEIRKETDEEINKVLNLEQAARYEEITAEYRAHRNRRNE